MIMDKNVSVQVNGVSKKFCKDLRLSMAYGVRDICRNMIGLGSRPEVLRKNEFWATKDVFFEIKQGETVGLIGPNGSGKTTMLKMLNGIFWPDKGKITIRGRTGALIAVGAGFHPDLTGRENIYLNGAILGMTRRDIKKNFDAIIEFADIGDFLETPVKYYSSGMYVRLGFAIAVYCEPDILLVDEVLAVGDEGFQNKCFNRIGELRSRGVTTILVSHNMHAVTAFCERAILMDMGIATNYPNVSEAVKAYADLFLKHDGLDDQRITSGNEYIQFYDVKVDRKVLNPHDSFGATLKYRSVVDYDDIEVDIKMFHSRESSVYFQATNKTYGKELTLKKGEGELLFQVLDIPAHSCLMTIEVAVWAKDHQALLFWSKIPVQFTVAKRLLGLNLFQVRFEIGLEGIASLYWNFKVSVVVSPTS